MRTILLGFVLAFLAFPSLAQPSDRVPVDGFWMDRTEVTIGQIRSFTSKLGPTAAERAGGGHEFAGGWTRRPGWVWSAPYGTPGADHEPAVHVTWDEARAYCRAQGGRLPSMGEWRRAAYTETRATPTDGFETGKTYTYPVGDQPAGMNNSRQRHVPVGTTKRGVNGLFDMGANVWEWVEDRQGKEALTAGGSWWYGPDMAKASGAQWKDAEFYAVYIGFRCVYDGPALRSGDVLLFRHARAPGTGDPAGYRLDDCATQRNLSQEGRDQATAIGARLQAQPIPVTMVMSSRWCRAFDTAMIAFPGRARTEPAFDSFFDTRARSAEQTAQAKRIILDWKGPGLLVVVSHQVNITALTSIFPQEAEGVVLRPSGGDGFEIVARLKP